MKITYAGEQPADPAVSHANPVMNETIQPIQLDSIIPSPGNRVVGGFDQAKLEQLAESIKAVGVQQPAVVRQKGDTYELVAGERRWRASRLAGLDYLPCVVRELTDTQVLKIQVIENLQREDVHPLDEADGYERLRTEGGYDPELIAQEVGRSVGYVYQRLRLLKLIPGARELLRDGKINAAVAILVARLDPAKQDLVVKAQLTDWQLQLGVHASTVDAWIRQNLFLDLSAAAWKYADADLVKSAGACSECQKRTGSTPALFDDISGDKCSDPACYKAKQKAILERNLKSLEGKEHLILREGYGVAPKIEGAVEQWQWKECKKKDEGALPSLIICGSRAGHLIYAKMNERLVHVGDDQDDGDEGMDPEEAAQYEAEENRYKAKVETNRRLFDAIMAACAASQTLVSRLHLLARTSAAECRQNLIGVATWYGWIPKRGEDDDDEPALDQKALLQTVYDNIDGMYSAETISFLIACQIASALNMGNWGDLISRCLTPALELYRIDPLEIQAEVYAGFGVSVEEDDEDEDEEDGEQEEDGDEGEDENVEDDGEADEDTGEDASEETEPGASEETEPVIDPDINRDAVIEGTLHRIADGWCVCDRALNNKSWGTTEQVRTCPICFPDAADDDDEDGGDNGKGLRRDPRGLPPPVMKEEA